MTPYALASRRTVLVNGVRPASILVDDGRIAEIGGYRQTWSAPTTDVGDLALMAGVVDTHVHINEPGRTEWEGFESGTRSAAAGGVTTIVDMPLNSIPATTTAEGLLAKHAAAAGRCHVDVGFWGGVVPGNTPQLERLAAGGVCGFKCFLSPSGVAEFEHVAERDLHQALPVLAHLRLPLLVHAELPSALKQPDPSADPRSYRTWLATRPPEAEQAAIELLIRLAGTYGVHIHIVHLAAGEALVPLRAARADGVPVTVETCAHYLSFCAEDIPDGATEFKCAPPIRGRETREALWNAVREHDIDLIASDHSPAPPDMKRAGDGDFLAAWGGIASLQVLLPVVWTAAAARGLELEQLTRLLSAAPARLAGLEARKGRIAPGMDADLVIWDPDAEFVVDAQALHHRHPLTPYAGMRLRGRVVRTLVRGGVVYDEGRFAEPGGDLLLRGTATIAGA
jgi:allantoinase